jgi:multiple antibiotic resistance protein
MNEPTGVTALLGLSGIFTVFFVMLGPLKIIGPFAQRTRDLDPATARKIAALAFLISTAAVVAGGFVGRSLLIDWGISVGAMLITGGVIFFLVGLRDVLEQYETEHKAAPPLPAGLVAAAMQISFPVVVTPYGIATLVVLLANTHDRGRGAMVVSVLIGVMLLNLIAMLFARRLTSPGVGMALKILGTVLGVLQVGLAVQLMLRGLQSLGVLGS